MSTEPLAPHVDGLAYSRESPDTVDYAELHGPPQRRDWWTTIGIAASLVAAAVLAANTLVEWSKKPLYPPPVITQPATVQAPTPPLMTLGPVAPPVDQPTAPPARKLDNPDTVFATSWNEQMPAFRSPAEVCAKYNAPTYPDGTCAMNLQNTDPTNPEFIFLGRDRCRTIRVAGVAGPGIIEASEEIRRKYRDITREQSDEIVKLAIRAYCPEYAQYE